MGDDPRRTILTRRARFVAAALAGLGATAPACVGGSDSTGSSFDGGPEQVDQPPQVCLSAPAPPPQSVDSGSDGGGDASDAADAEEAG